jgi:hypothetical protein
MPPSVGVRATLGGQGEADDLVRLQGRVAQGGRCDGAGQLLGDRATECREGPAFAGLPMFPGPRRPCRYGLASGRGRSGRSTALRTANAVTDPPIAARMTGPL